ncbi:recombinase family protein [Tumebacillus lipolyticus]|uniref:Recombinase family protein n=1 Tax=Tumebacillus lipolyticus TaxID=1280370 RepID=A0ABW5A1C5_9BACL
MSKLPREITAIINYIRRSRQDEERERRTGEDTLSEQKQLMNRVLAEWGVPYEQRFEIGSGDKIDTRPIFKEIIEELQIGKWNAIAVKEISRMGRGSYTDMGRIYDMLQQCRIFIITPYKIYDPKNPSDLRQIRFELFLSREEFETTRERLMGARYNYSMQGKWMAGTVPFGYKFNEKTQKLELEEDQAEVVRLIFDLYAHQKMGYYSIATHLRKLEIRTATGKQNWQPEVIHRMLKKPVYIGQVNFRMTEKRNGKVVMRPKEEWIVVEQAHESIIDDETWQSCQNRLKDTKSKQSVTTDFSLCELASLISCHNCGKKMVRQYSVQRYEKKNGGSSIYEKEFLRCMCGVYVKYRDVETRLIEILNQFVLDQAQLKKGIETTIEGSSSNDCINSARLIEQLQQHQDTVQQKLERAYDLVIDGTVSKQEFEDRKAKYQVELEDLEKQKKYLSLHEIREEKKVEINVNKVQESISSLINVYHRLNSRARKNILLLNVFNRVELEVLQKGKGRRSSVFDLYIRLKYDPLA